MPWVKLDDQFPSHPKVATLAPAWRPLAVFLHINALCWCNQYLTNGRVPRSALSRLGAEVECLEMQSQRPITVADVADELVAVGLWEEANGDYIIHDFNEFQPTRRQVESRRRHVQSVRSAAGSKPRNKTATKREQTVQQTCNPDPDPDPIPKPLQERRAENAPAKGNAPVVADLWDAWRAACEAVGIAEFAAMPVKHYQSAKELLGMATVAEWRRAFDAFLDAPEFTGKRSWGMCLANAPQLLAHVRSNPGQRFGAKARTTSSRTDGNDAAAAAFLQRLGA